MHKHKLLDGKTYLWFLKLFLVYVFFEFLLLNLSPTQFLDNAVKLAGDGITIIFLIYTLLRSRRLLIIKGQHLGLALIFFGIAAISMLINQGSFFDLFMGVRYLFRYYLIFLLSFYYDITPSHFREFSGFIIKSFLVEFPIFIIGYIFFGSVQVLYMNYLLTAIYLNAIFILILNEGRFSAGRLILIALIIVQAILSTSRLAVIGLMVSLIVFLLLTSRQKRVKITAATVGLIILGGIITLAFVPLESITESDTMQKFAKLSFDPESDTNFRLYLLTHYLGYSIQTVNLFGDGPNTFGDLYYHEEYHYQYGFDERTVHYAADSHFVILLMQYGFIGLAAYAYFLFRLVRNIRKEFAPAIYPFMAFMILAIFSIPVLSIRISSFLMFALLSLAKRGD